MKQNKENSKHYKWGDDCLGWHLTESTNLSVIEELMPPNTEEQKHYHNFSEQYFYILNGIATFEVRDKLIKVDKRNGIYIPPQVKHRVSNRHSKNLEFIVISHPTTRGDRINEPFEIDETLNLNGKNFKSVSSTENGEVNGNTIFNYHQKGKIVWATYEGGAILFGTLSGFIENSTLHFSYQHQNIDGHFMTGKCKTIVEIDNGRYMLKEEWEWTCDDYSKGKSILKEIQLPFV